MEYKMNKLIELMKEAEFCLWEDESWKPEGAIIDWSCNYDKELVKFAELIVQHAAEIANYMEETEQTDVGPAILEYFGVKENVNE
jgi:hypothetical protein